MPAIDFPASPSVNDEYSFEGRTWLWNGTGWEVKSYPAALQLGSASAPSLYFTGDTNTGLYSPGADQVAITTGGTGRLFVNASGNVGINAATVPTATLHIRATNSDTIASLLRLEQVNAAQTDSARLVISADAANNSVSYDSSGTNSGAHVFLTGAVERMRLSPGGRLGIATSNPQASLDVNGVIYTGFTAADQFIAVFNGDTTNRQHIWLGMSGTDAVIRATRNAGTVPNLTFQIDSTERARIDSSGRLLVGTSSARTNLFTNYGPYFQIETAGTITQRTASFYYNGNDTGGAVLALASSRGATVGSNTIVQSGDELGQVAFLGADGTKSIYGAVIAAAVDGTPGLNAMPGRLLFSTTADGAASPTERLRIDSAGVLQIADAGNIAVGTTTGTKIGTATTQKLGFFNKTPVVQPTAVANATDAASVITQLNALLARMRDLGLIAT